MNLSDAVIGLRAYKEVDERATQLWRGIENAILFPRMDTTKKTLQGIYVDAVRRSQNCSTIDAATNMGHRTY